QQQQQHQPLQSPQQQQQQQPHQRSLSIKDLISTPPAEEKPPQVQYFPVFPHKALQSSSSSPVTTNGAEADLASSGDLESVVSASERSLRAGSVLSMEDPDVRIAAEALGDLRADTALSLWNGTSDPPWRARWGRWAERRGSKVA
ncbi:hypothetical protein GP486_008182, partial [Trichoglossum hirsutum]